MRNSALFTTIVDTYFRPALLKEAVSALLRQTYANLEIILVGNGATPETVEYIDMVEKADSRIKCIRFEQNQYSPDDPLKMLDVCLNAALRISTGDYIWYQADDDLIAGDYAEKMVALFRGNRECMTAAGLPVGIDLEGNLRYAASRTSNFRPRYMPGHLLALDVLREGTTLFSSPGTIFTVRRDVLVKAGGFHRCLDASQLFGIVPFGVTGFDESACFYWRNHGGQLSRELERSGWLGVDDQESLLEEWQIERRWQIFGADVAREVVSRLRNRTCRTGSYWFVVNLSALRVAASWRILRKLWARPHFWLNLVGHLTTEMPKRLVVTGRSLVKRCIRLVFRLVPPLTRVSLRLTRLYERVNA